MHHDHVVVCTWGDEEATKWVRSLGSHRARVVEVRNKPSFHKTAALNLACMEAIHGDVIPNAEDERVNRLLVLDADTKILDAVRFEDWYAQAIRDATRFHVCLRKNAWHESWDVTGVVLMDVDHFLQSGGYDEQIRGWGCDDLEFRLRLALKLQLDWQDIPGGIFGSIRHSDGLRVQHYGEKDKNKSNARNARIMLRNVLSWTGGKPLQELDGKYRPLLSVIDRK